MLVQQPAPRCPEPSPHGQHRFVSAPSSLQERAGGDHMGNPCFRSPRAAMRGPPTEVESQEV